MTTTIDELHHLLCVHADAIAHGAPNDRVLFGGQELLPLHPDRLIYRGRLSRKRGARMLPGGVNCARPGRWGNPWIVGYHGTSEECVGKFKRDCHPDSQLEPPMTEWLAPLVARHRQHGHLILYCWCKLGEPCHCRPLADALVAELERQE